MDDTSTNAGAGTSSDDQKDLATFGYKQELHRTLGFFSSFAAAFSYISPSTGILARATLLIGQMYGAPPMDTEAYSTRMELFTCSRGG